MIITLEEYSLFQSIPLRQSFTSRELSFGGHELKSYKVGLANHTSTCLSKTPTWPSRISRISRETGKSGGLGIAMQIRAGSTKEPDL